MKWIGYIGCCLVATGCTFSRVAQRETVTVLETARWSPPTDTSGTLPPVLIYKTRHDYRDRVPVMMDALHQRIVAYPDPSDLYVQGKPALPIALDSGYLLDRRGIGPHVAFLTYTYAQYLRLEKAPNIVQLTDSLLDRYPLTELWQCGPATRSGTEVSALNTLIQQGFRGCKALTLVLPKSSEKLEP